ncbi:hypothetical protein [Protaetiibacter intestinalis]|uniref:Uncharacterized protein n=1 Tax=Protaetiibacter intestinalis TaxID=2419774 RepID=A0A387B4H4_9MICO|nr:hypothetical protein [Protaetiibacter intestinalis]AYF98544.1 hypothetical protein D7I47_09910 [Protaetiibacter intestinalis]
MDEWIEHRRGDGERVGWILPVGDGFVAIDLLGRERTGQTDWSSAENALEELGIGYLADLYELRQSDGAWLTVRIAEVSSTRVVVKDDDFGAVGAPQRFHELPLPVGDELRPLGPGARREFRA